MSDRREALIVELLRLAADPYAHGAAWEGIRGSSSAVPMRPHEPRCRLQTALGPCTCWMRSLDETHRCLRLMRGTERRLWYAVAERYVLASRKPTVVIVKRGRPQLAPNQQAVSLVNRTDLNRHGNGTSRMLIESWRDGLDPDRITAGVTWLAVTFRGQPELPVDFLNAA